MKRQNDNDIHEGMSTMRVTWVKQYTEGNHISPSQQSMPSLGQGKSLRWVCKRRGAHHTGKRIWKN